MMPFRNTLIAVGLLVACNSLTAQISIDVEQLGPRLNKGPVGLCLSFPTDEDSQYPERVQTHAQAFRTMQVGTLRWPMGTLADNYLWHKPGEYETVDKGLKPCVASGRAPARWKFCTNPDGSIKPSAMDFDEFIALCRKLNVEPVVMVNALGHIHRDAKFSYEQIKASAVEMVKYAKRKNFQIKYWEIGNEVSIPIKDGKMTVEEYVDLFNDFSVAMKQADPTVKTGLGLGFQYFKPVLDGTMEHADFIVPHIYVSEYGSYAAYENDASKIGLNSVEATQEALSSLPEPYRSDIKVLVTEFSSYSPQRRWDNVNNDIGKSLVTFDLAASMLSRFGNMEYLHFWVTHSPWGGVGGLSDDYANSLDESLNILPQGKALQIFNMFALERMLVVNPVEGKVRVFTSFSPEDKALSIYLLNKGTTPVTQKVQLKNYDGNARNKVWVFRGEGSPSSTKASIVEDGQVVVADNAFEINLAPVSIAVVTFRHPNKKED
ncbi:hypothetical protein [Haloferula sp.]|uniref:hypothetical protein n=1 Tax=Haloferula sp. TaxID=2497595 RepID=UPI00329CC528